ncbi:MAG: ferrous iron transport protein B [Pseudomonadota bacterium]
MASPDAQASPVIIAIGNPNTGKSTLFNALTGLRQKTANFPGVTVEKHVGTVTVESGELTLVDLPGTYSLSARSIDELIAIDVLVGNAAGLAPPTALLVVLDATNLYRNLFLAHQLRELGLPMVFALTMTDLAPGKGVTVNVEALQERLGAPVIPVVARTGEGMEALRRALASAGTLPVPGATPAMPELRESATTLQAELAAEAASVTELERAILEPSGPAGRRLAERIGDAVSQELQSRNEALGGPSLPAAEARTRYAAIRDIVEAVETRTPPAPSPLRRLGRVFNRPVPAFALFLVVMAVVFQAVFSWATPLMDIIDAGAATLSAAVSSALPPGALNSLLSDGVIAGVGAVVIFLPQILILFLFIIVLEDMGYMARAAFMMDRIMRAAGLSGRAVIPLISSFACAVPGIMGTRVISDRRTRIATIIAAPFMTCSARLPVYALLIAAFVPRQSVAGGLLNLQGLVLFGLYALGIVGGILTAMLIKRTALRGADPTLVLELPGFRLPDARSVAIRLIDRGKAFLKRAGTVIFTVAIVVWALAYFPRPSAELLAQQEQATATATATLSGQALEEELTRLANLHAAQAMEQSALGRIGKGIEPIFRPLGWDWRLSAAVVAGFPAREVVIAVLGTIFAVGNEAEPEALSDRLQNAQAPDGTALFTLPVVLGLMVFYAFCLQCAATVAVIRRETNSWRWPVFAWTYMTVLAYVGAFLTVNIAGAVA